jgi:tetratricopeptide (TPR) repeat protein
MIQKVSILVLKAFAIPKLLLLFFVFQTVSISAQQTPPLLNWVKTNEHLKLKKCIDTLEYGIKKSHDSKDFELTSKYLQKQSHLFLTRLKNFEKCMFYIEQIKDLSEESGNTEYMIDYYNQLGVTYYHEQLNMKNSFDYFKKALDLSKELRIEKNISRTLSNCGLAYLQKENFPVALDYFRRAIASYKKEYKKEGTIEFYSNMGVAYIYAQKNDSASFYLSKALELANETPGLEDDAERLMYLGVFNQEIGNNDEALNYLSEANKLITKLVSFSSKILVCQGLADAYSSKNDYKLAHEYRMKEIAYRDSLREISLQESALAYQFKDELRLEKDKTDKIKLYVIILSLIVLVLVIAIWFYINRVKTARRNAEIKLQNEQLEKENAQLELENNEREMTSKSMFLLEKDNLIHNISDKLRATLPKLDGESYTVVNGLISELNFSLNNKRWDEFEMRFNKVHPNFIRNLEKKHPKLSNNERKLCSFLLMNMSSKDISTVTGQTVHSINIARSRLRNKLNLVHTGEELGSYLAKFSVK